MLTPQDHANLLAVLTSSNLTLNGSQVEVLAVLQFKLKAEIENAKKAELDAAIAAAAAPKE